MTGWKESELKKLIKIRTDRKAITTNKIANIPMELISDEKQFCEYEIKDISDVKSYTYCESGDLLLAKITPSLENGKQGIVPNNIPEKVAYATTEVFPIISEHINNLFLFYLLKLPKYRQRIIASMIGTTGRQRASRSSIENLKVKVPESLSEQTAIANILSTVDEAIQKADEAINKTERIKQAMLQKLMTEGLGHTEFKETKIGGIPKEWDVFKLSEISNLKRENHVPQKNGNLPFVGLEHISTGTFYLDKYGFEKDVVSSKSKFSHGDILYGKLRPYLDKVNISKMDGISSTDILIISPLPQKAISEFLLFILHSKRFINFATARMSGTNHPRVSWREVSKFALGLPSINEQKKISAIIVDLQQKIELGIRKKQKFETIKQGLMDDLLTGRKRVKL